MREEGQWWAFAIRRLSDWVCDCIPGIPLPAIPVRDPDGQPSTHIPISDWAERRLQRRLIPALYEDVSSVSPYF